MTVKALAIDVYRRKGTDCSNGGISWKFDRLLLVGVNGPETVDMDNPPANAVKMVTRTFGFGTFSHLEPLNAPDDGCVGWMAGGAFGYTSDSRFPSSQPISIHDRQETQEQYDMLSR